MARIPGHTRNFDLAVAAAGRGSGEEGDRAYDQAVIADREKTNAKVFQKAQALFGDQGSSRLLQNETGGYFLPQTANPRRQIDDGGLNWQDAWMGEGLGVQDTARLNEAKGILGSSSGLAQADAFDVALNRARASQKMKPDVTRQDRMLDQFAQASQYLK